MRKRRGPPDRAWGVLGIFLLAGVLLVAGAAFTASNDVSPSKAGDQTVASVPDVFPSECAGLELNNSVSGSGIIAGSLGNDWIVGSDQVDTISGLAGNDCIEGKGADDVIDGGLGNDVCLGGPGVDVFIGCETQVQ